MAKQAPQKRKWPSDGKLQSWLVCYLQLLEAEEDTVKAASRAYSALRHLAAVGFESQSLKLLEGFLQRLPKTEVKKFEFMALLGANIGLEFLDLRRVNKFLSMIETRPPDTKRRKSPEEVVQNFREQNGLVPLIAGAEANEEVLPRFGRARQKYNQAMKTDDRALALRAIWEMAEIIPELDQFWTEEILVLSVIKAYRRLDGEPGVAKYIQWLDKHGNQRRVANGNLVAMGFRSIAIERSQRLILENLKELKNRDDPNVHFPVASICEYLTFLMQIGEKGTAKKYLDRAFKEMPSWRGMRSGFATSGAYSELAEVLVELDGPEAAQELLSKALVAGNAERHQGFRKSAVRATHESTAATGGTAAAIEAARKVRSASSRRKQLVPSLARIGNWKELKQVLSEVESNKEATNLAYAVTVELPDGILL